MLKHVTTYVPLCETQKNHSAVKLSALCDSSQLWEPRRWHGRWGIALTQCLPWRGQQCRGVQWWPGVTSRDHTLQNTVKPAVWSLPSGFWDKQATHLNLPRQKKHRSNIIELSDTFVIVQPCWWYDGYRLHQSGSNLIYQEWSPIHSCLAGITFLWIVSA